MDNTSVDLFTERVKAGKRTYFFDVRENTKGDRYLLITESRKLKDGYRHNRIKIYEEDIIRFNNAFSQALKFILGEVIKK